MTVTDKPLITTQSAIDAMLWRHMAVGAIGGALITVAAVVAGIPAQASTEDIAQIQRLLKAGCHFPQQRGEAATWAIGADGLIDCWEQRDRGVK